VAAVVVVFVLVGSRNVLNQPLPLVGQLPSPSGGLGGWWHTWWDGPGAGALSTTAFAPPGLLLMSVVGVLALGSANVAVHILTLAPLVIGPWGTYAQTRQFGSQRGRLAAAIVYAAVPAPYNALASGHWAGLVAYALAPWLIGALFRQGGQAPFPPVSWARAWPRLLALGAAVAIGACLTPAMLLLVPVLGAALLVGSLLAGPGNGGLRFFLAALGATVVAYLALAPWSFEIMRSWSSALGSPSGGEHPLSLSQLLRLQTGPFGGGPLAWAVVGAAVVPLVIGRAWRLAFAVRLWTVAATCLGLVWAGSRGWVPVPQLEFLMAPAGAALALAAAAGAAAIEVDLSGYRFGWRQAAPAVAALAVATATLPAISWAAGGQWGLPASGAEGAFAFPSAAGPGDYRTLWLGDASSLPLAAQGSVQGVAFATSLDGLPSTEELWSPGPSQLSSVVQADLGWAAAGETIALGHLLAPLAVRYVVVPLSGGPGPTLADLVLSLDRQSDLVPVGTDPSYAVFANSAWAPVFSVLAPGERLPPATGAWSVAYALQRLDLASAEGVQAGAAAGQSAVAGTGVKGQAVIFGAVSPGAWQLRAGGRDVPSQPALGFATTWTLPQGTKQVVISRRGASGQRDVDLAMLVVWLMALWAVWPRLRAKLETQLTLVNLDRGRPGTDVAEIDWSQALEGQSLG
jgi:hypothetical protein